MFYVFICSIVCSVNCAVHVNFINTRKCLQTKLMQVRTDTTKLQMSCKKESYLRSAFVFSLSSTVIQAHDARRSVIKFQIQVMMRESVQLFLVKMLLRLA